MMNTDKSELKVIIDLQGFQREGNRKRGIGRYSLELVKSLIYYFPQNEYILFSNTSLYNFRNEFNNELNDTNLKVIYFEWCPASAINEDISFTYSKTFIATQLRSYALSLLHADIILLTSFFDGFKDNTLIDYDSIYELPPIVSIIYDLIPLINPSKYLDNDQEYKYFYFKKIKDLNRLDALLTISESSKNEIIEYTDFPEDKVFNISASCDNHLFNEDLKTDLDVSLNIKDFGQFLLYVGALDPRKNLYSLIKAYSLLPIDLLVNHKLVLVGPYSKSELILLHHWIDEFNLSVQNIIILTFISDNDLANLYKNCYLFVFPSYHEGFGLPVLEAISCGAPVIASNTTSVPEILILKCALFDPHSVDQIKDLIIKSFKDIDFYKLLKQNSKDRKNSFSWKITSDKVINAFSKILSSVTLTLDKIKLQSYIKDKNEKNYNYLVLRLSENNIFKNQSSADDLYKRRVASSIDLINLQAKRLSLDSNYGSFQSNWKIEGPFDSSYSLAILNRNFALALLRIGQNVALHSTEGTGDFLPSPDFLAKNPILRNIYDQSLGTISKNCIISRNLYPPRVNDLDSRISLFHAYGWEESLFPRQWVDDFNKHLDCITVMSNQVKKILIDSGVYLPIKVSGLGVDHIEEVESDDNFLVTKKTFSFLHISSCFPRKGIDILLKAYGLSFSSQDNVTLVIKTFPNIHNNVFHLLEGYKKSNSNYPDVNIIDHNLNDSEVKSLYKQCDVLVAPSYGEGFNLTVAEAMSLRIPVITTAWGGQMDFCNSSNSWLVDYEFEYSNSHFELFDSVWAIPSFGHLAKLMKEIYCSSPSLILSKVDSAKRSISKLKWDSVAQKHVDFISNLNFREEQNISKIGWISTWNTKCGIATYSEHFLSELKENCIVFSPKNTQKNQDNIIRCWNIGRDNLDELFNQIIKHKMTSVVIQFNYGFFDFLSFSIFIKRINTHKIKIIIFLHSTIDPASDKTKKIQFLKDSFSLCDKLLVHSPSDLNRLKDIGLVENVSLFPHGILTIPLGRDRVKKYFLIKKRFHFSTYGFCLPNKGFPELIKAVYLLHKDDFNCKLSLYTAIYDNDTSLSFYQELKNLISNLNLRNIVTINPSYMSDQETLKKLSKTDLVIFPYQYTNESASGAVRQGISSLTPVAVTPLPIFDDVADVVYQLPGTNPSLIASGLREWCENHYGKKISMTEKKWREEHSFSKLASRLHFMIKSIELNY